MATNDKRVLTKQERKSIYATSVPAGDRQVNGVFAGKDGRLAGGSLHISGESYLHGPLMGTVDIAGDICLPNGTAAKPSLKFKTDLGLGLYRPAAGTIGVASGSAPAMTVSANTVSIASELSTIGGADLSLNPGGANIDLNNKNLINVGSITSDPNFYQVTSGAPVLTANATPTAVITIGTTVGASYAIDCRISCISTADGTSSGAIKVFAKGKNIGGVVTANGVATALECVIDAPLSGIAVDVSTAGTDIVVRVIGLAGTAINWYGGGYITRTLL